MFIPLGTDRPLRRPTVVTYALVAITVVVYVAQELIAQGWFGQPRAPNSMTPFEVAMWVGRGDPKPWGFVTYAFVHGGWMHLIGNMVFLWVMGPNVEDRLGRAWFLLFYIVAAAASAGTHILFNPAPIIGASGAIAAVTGAYLVLFPHTQIRCLVFFFFIGVWMIPAWVFIGLAIATDIFLGATGNAGNVAIAGHLGGYAFGSILAVMLLAARLLSREPYDLFTIGKQAYRRRQLKELSTRRLSDPAARVAAGRRLHDEKKVEAMAAARAEVSRLLAAGEHEKAAAAYRELADRYAHVEGATLLPRRQQYEIANWFFQHGRHEPAAYAYERFLAAHPDDRESPRVRLMLGLICARYLNDPVRARAVLDGLAQKLDDDEEGRLARLLLEELG